MTDEYEILPDDYDRGATLTITDATDKDPTNPWTIVEAQGWDDPIASIPSCSPVPGTFQPYPDRYFAPPVTFTPYPLTEETGKEILEMLKRIEKKLEK